MTRAWRRRSRRWAWPVGIFVLLALGVSVWSLVQSAPRAQPRAVEPPPQQGVDASVPPMDAGKSAAPVTGRAIAGVVRLPDGRPAVGASVTIYRATSAWPEWRRERIDEAVTGEKGEFEFRAESPHGLLLGFEHTTFAGGLEEVLPWAARQELQLAPGFELEGTVLSDANYPVPNVRVVVESISGDARRAEVRTTAANGRFRFTNLAAGPVRVVARHASWQPAAAPVVVIGDRDRVELRFERPTMTPLRGRVTSAVSLKAVEGAIVELFAANAKLGLVDPITARTGPDGAFLLAGLPRGNMRMLVRHPDHGAVMRTLAIGTLAAELPIELPQRSLVEGRVVADGVSLRAGELLRIRDAAGFVDHAPLGADGAFRFSLPLSPGAATITALDRGFAFERSDAHETTVRVDEAANTTLELSAVKPSSVRGRLVDERGEPLAGGRVRQTRVLAENARSIGDAAVQLDLSRIGSQVVQLFGQDRDEVLAVSGADGWFEIRAHKPGPLLVRAELPGRGSRWLRLTVPDDGNVADLGPIPLQPGCRIHGRVLRGDRALAGAEVMAVGSECTVMAVTRADGAFTIDDVPPGEYRVRARLPSLPTGSRVANVTASTAAAAATVLTLDSGREVRGVVSGSDGQPLPAALVTVRGSVGATAVTDASGDFLLELPERAVELQVSLADRSRQTTVLVPPGEQRVAVRLDTPPTSTLAARIAGLPGRQPLPGALLRFTSLDGDVEGETRSRWVDVQDNELRWPLCSVGRVRVTICADGYAPFVTERDFVANETQDLGDVLLEPGSRLSGIVRDDAGAPVANASVLLGEETDLDLFEPRVKTAADGSFRIAGVTSRSARLVVRAPGFAVRTVDLQLPQDVLAAAPFGVDLERGSTIEVAIAAELVREGGIVQLRRQGRLVASSEIDERGRAWFPNRSAGSYTVQVFGSEQPAKEVVVDRNPVTTVRLP